MGKKYIINDIVQLSEEGKVRVYYTINGVTNNAKRGLYQNDGEPYVLFRGAKIDVVFDERNKKLKSAKVTEIYCEDKTSKTIEDFTIDIKNVEQNKTLSNIKQNMFVNEVMTKNHDCHPKTDELKVYIENDIPIYLYGPAGSGKSYTLKKIADSLGYDFYSTNSVQQEYKLTGFIDAGGKYHETEFYKAFKHGGLFFLDEIDASIPEVIILLNAAIANRYFEFPNGRVEAHEDFRVCAAGNTTGNGATSDYNGRFKLDESTLNRFAMVEFEYERNVELSLVDDNLELIEFIYDLRKQVKQKGISLLVSYRNTQMIHQLESKLPLYKVLQSSLVKGLDIDTLNTIQTTDKNKYSKALWVLKNKLKTN